MNSLFKLCWKMASRIQEYSIVHPEHDADILFNEAKDILEKYDVTLRKKAIKALDDAILRGDNIATSEARHILRQALETL
jgi:hypothetical protein